MAFIQGDHTKIIDRAVIDHADDLLLSGLFFVEVFYLVGEAVPLERHFDRSVFCKERIALFADQHCGHNFIVCRNRIELPTGFDFFFYIVEAPGEILSVGEGLHVELGEVYDIFLFLGLFENEWFEIVHFLLLLVRGAVIRIVAVSFSIYQTYFFSGIRDEVEIFFLERLNTEKMKTIEESLLALRLVSGMDINRKFFHVNELRKCQPLVQCKNLG